MDKIKTVLRESSRIQFIKKMYGKMCCLKNICAKNVVLNMKPEEAIRYLNSVHPCPSGIMVPMVPEKERTLDLSIIIPAHNASAYICQCLDSILKQKTQYSYELIIIENASSDGTWEIICKYEKNNRVRILQSEKADPSAARNAGLRISRGNYLMFVDADDYLLPGIIEQMMNAVLKQKADIVVCGFEKMESGKLYQYPDVTEKTVWTDVEQMENIYGFAWGKIYHWQLFEDVCFPENLWYEDTIIHMEIFPRAKKMIVLPVLGLVYRRNSGSITACHERTVRCHDTFWVMQAILQKRNEEGLKCDRVIYQELLKHFSDVSWIRIRQQPKEIKEAFFCAAAYLLDRERQHIQTTSLPPKMRALDVIFREKKEKLWENYCKYGCL